MFRRAEVVVGGARTEAKPLVIQQHKVVVRHAAGLRNLAEAWTTGGVDVLRDPRLEVARAAWLKAIEEVA